MTTSATLSFLKRHRLSANDINVDKILAAFNQHMCDGLSDDTHSSLAMIPSYIDGDCYITSEQPVIVLDLGGSNLRVALAEFDHNQHFNIIYYKKFEMPGKLTELSKADFFHTLYSYLAPVLERSNKIGLCFSYPSEISPNKDGKLLYWTKEIKAPEVVDQWIGAELNAEIIKHGFEPKMITLLNDTTATLLAGKLSATSSDPSPTHFVGLILGTGTNCAYIEKNQLIPQCESNEGTQVINIESGAFNGLPINAIDKTLDLNSSDPGNYIFEKMIAGRYLGELALLTLKQAATEGLFCAESAAVISAVSHFDTETLSRVLESQNLSLIFKANDELISAFNTEDSAIALQVLHAVVNRAAQLTAINVAAASIKSLSDTSGSSKTRHDNTESPVTAENHLCINIDGTTYYQLFGFKVSVEKYLASIFRDKQISYTLKNIEDAPLIGSAIAGLS